jgi:hypothetical protein
MVEPPLTGVADDLLRHALAFLPHEAGKAGFAQTGLRGRDVHASCVPTNFASWAAELSLLQRRFVAGLCVAPQIRTGFESGADCRQRSQVLMQELGQSDGVIGRLMAQQAALVEEEAAEAAHDESEGSFAYYFQEGEHWEPGTSLAQMWELPIVFLALGLLAAPRIEELLEVGLDRLKWSLVFDYRGHDDVNTILIDPLFSFAEWGKETVTSRYEMVKAVKQNGDALKYASDELKADRVVVLEAVKQDGSTLHYAAAELKADRGVVLAAVKQDGVALLSASAELKADRGVVLAAVKQNGDALWHASDELTNDRGVVLEAVKQNGDALKYASDELKADRGVVLAAVTQNGDALRHAGDELKDDRGVVLAAMKQRGFEVLRWASVKLQTRYVGGLFR